MKIRLLGDYEIEVNFRFRQQARRLGVNSNSFREPDRHMIIWDFDSVDDLRDCIDNLKMIQSTYDLPTIYLVESSVRKYHAYCFAKRTFKELLHILSGTPMICEDYLRIGAIRGYYTLRISEREGEQFRLVTTLASDIEPEMLPSECSLSDYLTYNKGGKIKEDNNA